MTASRNRRLDLLQKLALLALSMMLSGLAAEALWRFLRSRGYGPATNSSYVVHDDVLGWRYSPDSTSRHTGGDFDVEIRIDRQGRRSSGEDPVASGLPRVVFVGDSLTFGWGVRSQESFPSLTGQMLEVEVINLGVAGYGTDQQYLRLQRDGLPLAPAAVVLTFCQNDLSEVISERKYGRTKPRYRFEGSRLVLSEAGERTPALERYSALYRSIRYFLARRSEAPLEGERLAAARRLVRRLIRSMAEDSRQVGARFIVVHSGSRWLSRGLGEDVERIDVGEALKRAASDGPVTFLSDPHWNARGHRVVAEKIGAVLGSAPSPPVPAAEEALEGRQDRAIGRRPVEGVELFGAEPPIPEVFRQMDLAGGDGRDIDVELDGQASIDNLSSAEPGSDLDSEAQLFANLPPQRRLGRLVRLHLATRELPLESLAGGCGTALGHQAGVASKDRCSDDSEAGGFGVHSDHRVPAGGAGGLYPQGVRRPASQA